MKSVRSRVLCLIAATAALAVSAAHVHAAASFQLLGRLSNSTGNAYATGVSADGSTVIGESPNGTVYSAFRWTAATGMQEMNFYRAYAVSGDGTRVAGYNHNPSAGDNAIRWTAATGQQSLGYLSGGTQSVARAASADGNTVFGYADTAVGNGITDYQAFRWTASSGIQSLGTLPGSTFSAAYGASTDGNVVTGASNVAGATQAFRWTPGNGMEAIGELPGGQNTSTGIAVSGDGLAIVGQSASASGLEAFRWTAPTGPVGLGDVPGGGFASTANAVTYDGSVIVGLGSAPSGTVASIWDSAHGMRDLNAVLQSDYHLNLGGALLYEATGISADGQTIVGNAIAPGGVMQPFVAVLPEPASAGLLAVAAMIGLRRRRR